MNPSHKTNQFYYLMTNTLEWSDLIPSGNGFNMVNICDLISTTIIKNAQGIYEYKMGIQCFALAKNIDYTLCIEILNVDYQLWHKSRISIDKADRLLEMLRLKNSLTDMSV